VDNLSEIKKLVLRYRVGQDNVREPARLGRLWLKNSGFGLIW